MLCRGGLLMCPAPFEAAVFLQSTIHFTTLTDQNTIMISHKSVFALNISEINSPLPHLAAAASYRTSETPSPGISAQYDELQCALAFLNTCTLLQQIAV